MWGKLYRVDHECMARDLLAVYFLDITSSRVVSNTNRQTAATTSEIEIEQTNIHILSEEILGLKSSIYPMSIYM